MDDFIKFFASEILRLETEVKAIKENPEKLLSDTFQRSPLTRPVLSKDEEDAKKMQFLKKSEDGKTYEAGSGYAEHEKIARINEKLEKCLKID